MCVHLTHIHFSQAINHTFLTLKRGLGAWKLIPRRCYPISMIDQHRLFILGDSLLMDGLVHLLGPNQNVTIVGCAYAIEEVMPYLESGQLDMLVIAGVSEYFEQVAGLLIGNYANLSVLFVHPDKAYMELFSIRRVIARYADLAAAIDAMSP